MSAKLAFQAAPTTSSIKLPERLEQKGLLVGWSLEQTHLKKPIGFTFGDPTKTPATGYIDPILMDGDGHLITIAPTGAGKGIGGIIPALLRYEGPAIVIDPKGENCAITARRRQELGQKIVVIDPMGVVKNHPYGEARFDPLDLVDPESPTGVDDAANLAVAMLPDTGAHKDLFWYSRARNLILGMILHAKTHFPDSPPLPIVRRLIADAIVNPVGLSEELSKSRHPEVVHIVKTLNLAASETLSGMLAVAQEGVDFIRGPLVQQAVSNSSFSLDDVTRGTPMTIYIVLPPAMLESHGQLLRLWISALICAVLRRRRKPERSTLFLLDEAAQLGSLPHLRQAVTLLRGYGLQTWSFWQDVSQLQLLYPLDWQTMINNCKVVQAFGAYNLIAAKSMSEIVGFGDGNSVLDLEEDEMLLQIAGDQAILARRPDYRTDPAFKGMYDPNPLFDTNVDPVPESKPPLRWYLRPEIKPHVEVMRNSVPGSEIDAQVFQRLTEIERIELDKKIRPHR